MEVIQRLGFCNLVKHRTWHGIEGDTDMNTQKMLEPPNLAPFDVEE